MLKLCAQCAYWVEYNLFIFWNFLGETGSGKSSFINVLLGEDFLPTSLLSNTHVICEIRSSRDQCAYAIVFPVDENENSHKKIEFSDGGKEVFKRDLASIIQAIDEETGKPVYNRAQIYLPCDILEVSCKYIITVE